MEITRIAIIDVSGSMRMPFSAQPRDGSTARRTKRSQKCAAALDYLRFAIQKMPPGSELIIISFAESAEVVYQGRADNSRAIDHCISRLSFTGSSTNLAAAFNLVLQIIQSGQHRIRPIDVVTDGLSNVGDPVQPARELQKRHGVYMHLYLIDLKDEGMMIANNVVGNEGEGEVDPVSSEAELMGRKEQALNQEREVIDQMHHVLKQQEVARAHFFAEAPPVHLRPSMTVSYPEVITPAQWRPIQLFLYSAELSGAVERELQKIREEVEEYGDLSAHFPQVLPEGCSIRVQMSSNELRVNPSEVTINWYEPYNKLHFRVATIEQAPEIRSASLNIDVFADDLPVACLGVSILIDSDARDIGAAQSSAQCNNGGRSCRKCLTINIKYENYRLCQD